MIFVSYLMVLLSQWWLTLSSTAGSSSFESQKMDRPSISVMSPTSPGALRDLPLLLPGQLSVSVLWGQGQTFVSWKTAVISVNYEAAILRIMVQLCWTVPRKSEKWVNLLEFWLKSSLQVKLWYDKVGHQLIVNVLQAIDLPPRPDGRPRNPYVKMYFLPDRRYVMCVFVSTLYVFIFTFNILHSYINLVDHISPPQKVLLLWSVHVCVIVLVIRVKDGPKQWRRVLSPSGTKPLYIPMFTGGTSESACWRSRCGTSPESRRRRVNSWARSETDLLYISSHISDK